jgi:maltose/moltooligosaccharide transporter
MQVFSLESWPRLPTLFQRILRRFGITGNAANGVPLSVQYASAGAVVFLLAVSWTVLTSKEYPPETG